MNLEEYSFPHASNDTFVNNDKLKYFHDTLKLRLHC